MKGNNGTGNNISRDDWQTPDKLWQELDNQYGFNFDCCANEENKKCINFTNDFLSRHKDYLEDDTCWMNPPFSKAHEMIKHFFKVVNRGVMIYRCDNMETKVWQDEILKHSDWVFIFNKRIEYEGHLGKGSRFPSAIIGIGVNPPKKINGTLLLTKSD